MSDLIEAEYRVLDEDGREVNSRREPAIRWRNVPAFLWAITVLVLARLAYQWMMAHHWPFGG